MCLPAKSDQPAASSGSQIGSILGPGVLMPLACLAGPAIAGAVSALGIGVLAGAGGAVLAVALCVAIPAAVAARRRRATG